MSSPSKSFKGLVRELKIQGWTVEQRGNSTHYQAVPPDRGMPIVHFSKSGDPRALDNTLSDLRKSGFEWPPPPRSRPSPLPSVEDPPTAEESVTHGTAEATEDDMDELWMRLKEARGYYQLAEEQLMERRSDVEEAKAALAAAEAEEAKAGRELEAARSRLGEAKAALDRAVLPDALMAAS